MIAKQTALDAYLAHTASIHAKLARLQQLADYHFGHDPDAINWSYVDDLGRVEGGWRLGWASCCRSSASMLSDDANQLSEMIVNVKLTATKPPFSKPLPSVQTTTSTPCRAICVTIPKPPSSMACSYAT